MSQTSPRAYIIAGRRTAIGRLGGLHRGRRVEELAGKALDAALADARLTVKDVQHLVLGNASQVGNPARLAGLGSGLPETIPALTIDRQCASGLDAILIAIRLIASGEADIVAAGGAESLSTAPWQVARPRTPRQPPRFLETVSDGWGVVRAEWEAAEALASQSQIARPDQDAYALATRRAAASAQTSGRLGREIVAMHAAAPEGRDEAMTHGLDATALGELPALLEDGGTLTSGNTSAPGDGAAMVIVVGDGAYRELGRPAALRLVASAAIGTPAGAEAQAPILAVRRLRQRLNGSAERAVWACELNESCAAQAIAFRDSLGIPATNFNRNGGTLAHGRPLGASSAVLVVSLFAQLLAAAPEARPLSGLAATGALGGLGLAAVFETHRP